MSKYKSNLLKRKFQWLPPSPQRTRHVESTSIRWRYYVDTSNRENIDEFKRHFDVPFQCNFDVGKIDILTMYFFRRSFDDWKIDVVWMYFTQRDFNGQKIDDVWTYFVRPNFDGKKNRRCFDLFFDVILMEN